MGTGYLVSSRCCVSWLWPTSLTVRNVCVHITMYWMMWWKGFIKSLLSARFYASHYTVGKTGKVHSYLKFRIQWILFFKKKKTPNFHTRVLGSYVSVASYHCNCLFLTNEHIVLYFLLTRATETCLNATWWTVLVPSHYHKHMEMPDNMCFQIFIQ